MHKKCGRNSIYTALTRGKKSYSGWSEKAFCIAILVKRNTNFFLNFMHYLKRMLILYVGEKFCNEDNR